METIQTTLRKWYRRRLENDQEDHGAQGEMEATQGVLKPEVDGEDTDEAEEIEDRPRVENEQEEEPDALEGSNELGERQELDEAHVDGMKTELVEELEVAANGTDEIVNLHRADEAMALEEPVLSAIASDETTSDERMHIEGELAAPDVA